MSAKFWGKVRKHKARGQKLGFPTANVSLSKKIPEGIYISQTKIQNKRFNSLTFIAKQETEGLIAKQEDTATFKSRRFIGRAETFNEEKYHAETYILDFNKNIYNFWISVKLIKKIRNSKKFSSAGGLIKQMRKDEETARKYFQNCQEHLKSELFNF